MSTLKISDGVVKDEVLVLGLTSTNSKGGLAIETGEMAIDTKTVLAQLNDMGATGKADEVIKVPGTHVRLLVFTGLGSKSAQYTHENLRRAAGAASRALAGNSSATFSLPAKSLQEVAAVAEGAALGAYSFTEFRGSTKADFKAPLKTITIHSKLASSADAKAAVTRAAIIAKYTYLVRDLINTPPSHLTPDSFTKKVAAVVKSAGGAKSCLLYTSPSPRD